MNKDNINAKAMREVSDKAFESNTKKVLMRILGDIEAYAERGEKSYCYYLSYLDFIDMDYLVQDLTQRGFKVRLQRSFWLFGNVEEITVIW